MAEGKLISHGRCQSHVTQLINVALLSGGSVDVMAGFYGLAVFLRSLGYFNRLQQALCRWVEANLVFRDELYSVGEMPAANGHLKQLLEYLQHWKDQESETPEKESAAFKARVARVLDMFNADVNGAPCHVCTSAGLPAEARHCLDRADCVSKASDAPVAFFLGRMPNPKGPRTQITGF